MLTLSGTLKTPAGAALANTTVRFFALATSETVLQGTTGEFTTDAQGGYAVSLESGYHRVTIQPGNTRPVDIGRIYVTSNTDATTLNELLLAASASSPSNPLADEILAARNRAEAAALQSGQYAIASDRSSELAARSEGIATTKSAEADNYAQQASSAAAVAINSAASASDDAEVSSLARAEAIAARDAALIAGSIYPSIAAGVAAVADGEYFTVPDAGADYLILYRRAGAASVEQKRYPSSLTLSEAIASGAAEHAALAAALISTQAIIVQHHAFS